MLPPISFSVPALLLIAQLSTCSTDKTPRLALSKQEVALALDVLHARCESLCRGISPTTTRFCASDDRMYSNECTLECVNAHLVFAQRSLVASRVSAASGRVQPAAPTVEHVCESDCRSCLRGGFLPPPLLERQENTGEAVDLALRKEHVGARLTRFYYDCESSCSQFRAGSSVCASDGREYYKGRNCHLACVNRLIDERLRNPLLRLHVLCEPRRGEHCANCSRRVHLALVKEHLEYGDIPIKIDAQLPRSAIVKAASAGVTTLATRERADSSASAYARVCKFCRPGAADCSTSYIDYSCAWTDDQVKTHWCVKIDGDAKFGGLRRTVVGGSLNWQPFTYRSCYSQQVRGMLAALYAIDESDVPLGECRKLRRQSANVTICTCDADFCNAALPLKPTVFLPVFLLFCALQ